MTGRITKIIITVTWGGGDVTKMGRPKSNVTKNKIVTIRMSDEEYEKLKAYAKLHQMTVTELIKKGVDQVYTLS